MGERLDTKSNTPDFFSKHQAAVRESHLNESVDDRYDLKTSRRTAAIDYVGAADTDSSNGADDAAQKYEYTDIDEPGISGSRDYQLLDIDYRTTLAVALDRKEADLVVRCIISAYEANDYLFIQALSNETFSKILMIMQPSLLVNDITSVHRDLSIGKVRQLGIASANRVAREYSDLVVRIVEIRLDDGRSKLGLDDYVVFLRSARDLGNHKMASFAWGALLRDGHTPDTRCYNHYMAAHVWNGRHRHQHRQKVRVTPFNKKNRLREERRAKFSALDIASADTLTMAQHVFDTMSTEGVAPDEESYRILIVAAARQGRVSEVKTILKKIWEIDVDTIQQGALTQDASQRIGESLPLRPCQALLVTIAHAFGINNDIPTALRVIDRIAQQHRLFIDEQVWDELFERTFVLSIDRTGTSRADGSKTGQLPVHSLQTLWDTMIGEPYRVQPTMRMYNYLIKNLASRARTPIMVTRMSEGLNLYKKHRDEAATAFKRLKAAIAQENAGDLLSSSIENLRYEWEHRNLLRRRDVYLLKRWMSLLLQSFDEWHRVDWVDRHYACGLPALLWGWREWAPTLVEYETPTAFVAFNIRSKDDIALRSSRKARTQQKQRRVLDAAPRLIGQDWTWDVKGNRAILPSAR
jgi:hypothetical protein